MHFQKLLNATTEQKEKYKISGDGLGLHWDDLDEDLSVSALLSGKVPKI